MKILVNLLLIQMQLSMKENVQQYVVKLFVPKFTYRTVLVNQTLLIASNIRTNVD